MFFFIILVTAISGMPALEICFLPGTLRRTILPKERYGDSLSVGESDTQPSSWKDPLPLSYRHSSKIFVANPQVSGDVMMCSWGVTEEPTIRDKWLSYPWLFTVISCKAFFIKCWEEGQYKPRTTGALTFASVPSNVISFFVQRGLSGMAEMALSGEEGVGTGAQLPPK